MADIENLFGEIRSVVPEAPEPLMQDALIRAAQEFCADSWWLRRNLPVVTQANVNQYLVTPPPNEEIIAAKHAQVADTQGNISPMRFPYGTTLNPMVGAQQPWEITYIPEGWLQFNPTPDQAYNLLVECITQPILEADTIADELVRKWSRALGYGALAWVLRQKSEDWFDPQESDSYTSKFSAEIIKARTMAAFDNTPGPHAWLKRRFIGTGRGNRRY